MIFFSLSFAMYWMMRFVTRFGQPKQCLYVQKYSTLPIRYSHQAYSPCPCLRPHLYLTLLCNLQPLLMQMVFSSLCKTPSACKIEERKVKIFASTHTWNSAARKLQSPPLHKTSRWQKQVILEQRFLSRWKWSLKWEFQSPNWNASEQNWLFVIIDIYPWLKFL